MFNDRIFYSTCGIQGEKMLLVAFSISKNVPSPVNRNLIKSTAGIEVLEKLSEAKAVPPRYMRVGMDSSTYS
jgi:hypothetical protein